LQETKDKYGIAFKDYSILIYHPVFHEISELAQHSRAIADFILSANDKFILIAPNNDPGSNIIEDEFSKLKSSPSIRYLPSMRFEHYLTLLKNSRCIVGNSSSGIREAPFYGIPTVNIGSRQKNRSTVCTILNCEADLDSLSKTYVAAKNGKRVKTATFGGGDSANEFRNILLKSEFWAGGTEKQFIDQLS